MRNRPAAAGLVALVLVGAVSLAAPLLPLADPDATAPAARLLAPLTPGAWLGTDALGRDLLARLVHGTRVSLAVGLAAASLAAGIGSGLGLVAGFAGGRTEALLMRLVDVLMAFPYLLLALAVVAALGPGLLNALAAVVVANIPFFARTVRGVAATLRVQDFVAAARLSGMGPARILLVEILPNVLPVIAVTASTTVGWMILETAGLSFLGLGAQPPQADLGAMLGEGRRVLIGAPAVAAVPGFAVLLIVLALNLVGDGLRDALDPRLAGGPAARPGAATRVARPPLPAAPPAAGPPPADGLRPADGLAVAGLRVAFETPAGRAEAVRGVDLAVAPGECLGLVGASGSGKSVTAHAILRLVPSPPGLVTGGAIRFRGEDLLALPPAALRRLRGDRIAYVFQDPLTTLHPLIRVGDQVAEAIRAHRRVGAGEAASRAEGLLAAVALPDPGRIARAYPHELSGGQRQRVGIAMALANDPDLIVADEPTTALDATVQAGILDLLDRLRRERGLAILFISHDVGVVRRLCDRVAVMQGGRIVEAGEAARVLSRPQHPTTRGLIAAVPVLGRARALLEADEAGGRSVAGGTRVSPAVEVRGLAKTYPARGGLFARGRPAVTALGGVSFRVAPGETLGIVGESGCGKSTLARCLVGLVRPSAGSIVIEGRPLPDLVRAGPRVLGRTIQYVFQDPVSALNPRRTIRQALAAPLRFLAGLDAAERPPRLAALMDSVGLEPAHLDRYPHELSGGQAQRVAIARALAAGARIVVLDEPVAALDLAVQAKVLRLLADLRARHGLTAVLISHDLAVVEALADRVLVMEGGAVVEEGTPEAVFGAPRHPYTRRLVASVAAL
nr:dipeptide ABC transporter ATP-binding protein [Methylobacterium sp. WSM2598]